MKVLGTPIKLSDSTASVRTAPPTLGQHTDAVLAELGLSIADIAPIKGPVSRLTMETSQVRRRVLSAITSARGRAQERRERTDEAARDYAAFLQNVATPVVRQVASALNAERYAFTVSTPGDGLRLASDRGRDDYVEFALDTSGEHPQVIGRISQARGSRRLEEERPVKADASPAAITEEDVLEFVMQALESWLAR